MAAGCHKVWVDGTPQSLDRCPQLDVLLEAAGPGDTLVVWRLDRFGQSLRQLIAVVIGLDERGVGFRSLREDLDTTAPGGSMVHLFTALKQFERELIRDRTMAGLAAAEPKGRVPGRPTKLSDEQRQQTRDMHDAQGLTPKQIGQALGVSRTTIFRTLNETRPAASDPRPPPPTPASARAAGRQAAGPGRRPLMAPPDEGGGQPS